MKVLMLGVFNFWHYARGRIIYRGLKENKVDVELFLGEGIKGYFRIANRILKRDYSIIIANGKIVLLICWLLKLFHRRKIIFDAFISDFENLVEDRGNVKKNSLKAKAIWQLDRLSCLLADRIILDTEEHIDYFVREFKLDKARFKKILVGSDIALEKMSGWDSKNKPSISYGYGLVFPNHKPIEPTPSTTLFSEKRIVKKKTDAFNVTFYGSFIPLHGLEYILWAAKILEKERIIFEIIGSGQTFEKIHALSRKLGLKNVNFRGFLGFEELTKALDEADICLGIFGKTKKAERVIPNKAFDAIAKKKPLITSRTPAILRLFTHKKNAYLCRIADSKSLADAILALKKNKSLREKIAEDGYRLYLKTSSPKVIGEEMKELISEELR